ncbi:hypothetical protein GQ54DRAFT_17154 [Martensiomyces pterosporus]|nr:hypothetical protein GQ54DRAFT_17154 [Martensiomyces pterosporus]
MKFTSVLVVLLSVAVCLVAAKNNFCAKNGNGNYVFAGSCSQFFSCSNGFGWLLDCPGDLLFDTTLMECIWHEQVDCGDRPASSRSK